MCVIFLANRVRPEPDQVEKAYDKNKEGAGIAWRNDKGNVVWEKGLDLPAIQKLVAKVPLPLVAHFRIASCGGDSVQLCHPFPVEEQTDLALTGETEGAVLFHNGHWTKWQEVAFDFAVRHGVKMPKGRFSDTRVMAWLAAYLGTSILDLINEKVVVFSKEEIEVFGTGWSKIFVGTGTDNFFWASNRLWENSNYYTNYNGTGSHSHSRHTAYSGSGSEKKSDDKEDHTRQSTTTQNGGTNSGNGKVADVEGVDMTGKAGGTSHQATFPETVNQGDSVCGGGRLVREGGSKSEAVQEGVQALSTEAKQGNEKDQPDEAVKVTVTDDAVESCTALVKVGQVDEFEVISPARKAWEEFKWACGFNKYTHKGEMRIPPYSDDQDRLQRMKEINEGKRRIGPM